MEEHERPFFEGMLGILEQVDAWRARLNPEGPRRTVGAGSALAGDDRRVNPYHTSRAAWIALSHAVDHLHAHRTVLCDAAMIHMYAHYSLLRGAFENASTAVWLLGPASRPERLTRRLRFAAADVRNGERVRQMLGAPAPRPAADRIDELKAIARRCGLDETAATKGVSSTEVVRVAGEHDVMGPTVAQLTWNLCSGTAHGDFWSMVTLAHRVDLPGAPAGIAHIRITASVERMFFLTFFSAGMISRGWALFDQRSATPHGAS
ncbi:hypothetical protein [Micromonospora cremea]|uniref:Uncharacterized protein n=1 Tax=Micromonospora cremea TaxID=709881 RepID=A0A1N5VHB6_9ACTN|nr:hypothetical protein [Micromonospora cremea]SIM72150.1 hypothetical protein SAMN04489832_1621 [Micromonospora cremea]